MPPGFWGVLLAARFINGDATSPGFARFFSSIEAQVDKVTPANILSASGGSILVSSVHPRCFACYGGLRDADAPEKWHPADCRHVRALSRETQHVSSQSIPATHTYQSQQVVCVLFSCSLARLFVCLFACPLLCLSVCLFSCLVCLFCVVLCFVGEAFESPTQVLPAPVRLELSCTHSMLEDVGLGELQTLTS